MQDGQRFNPFGLFTGVWIPDFISMDKDLSLLAKFTYGRLLRYAGKNGMAWPAQETLAEEIGRGATQIKDALKELVTAGYLEVEKPTGKDRLMHKTNRYHFIWREDYTKFSMGNDGENQFSGEAEIRPSGKAEIRPSKVRESIVRESVKGSSKEDPKKAPPSKISPTLIMDLWNRRLVKKGFPKILKLIPSRISQIKNRSKDLPTYDDWVGLFKKIEASQFLCGVNDRGWKAGFDFILNEKNLLKILEGKYDNQPAHKNKSRTGPRLFVEVPEGKYDDIEITRC
jgi:hypothetical protein